MQQVLSFVYKKKKYISKPWCFEAARLIEENRLDESKNSIMSVCADAVDYLFEGTEATQDILDAAVSSKMRMCGELWKWFMEDFTGKNEESLPEEQTVETEN